MKISLNDRRTIGRLIASIHKRHGYLVKVDEKETSVSLMINNHFLICSTVVKWIIWYLIGFRDALFLKTYTRGRRKSIV